jgi:hypothetical protein
MWQQTIGQTPITPLYATADGGAIVTSSTQCSYNVVTDTPCSPQLGTLYTVDQNGNVTSQSPDTAAVYSWTGQSYTDSTAGLADAPLGIADDQASMWAQAGGNPSQNGVAVAECPCLLQSTMQTGSSQEVVKSSSLRSERYGAQKSKAKLVPESTPTDPANCPICNLQPLNCRTVSGSQSTFLILVGDPGITYNVGYLFDLAAQTKANQLAAGGNRVVSCRVSDFQSFDSALLGQLSGESLSGQTTGGVIYFGHSGPHTVTASGQTGTYSILAVGEVAGPDTNVSFYNVGQLSNILTAYGGSSILRQTAALWLNGCSAGLDIHDDYAHGITSIAKGLSIVTQRGVYAYDVGTYFSRFDAASDTMFAPQEGNEAPQTLPVYVVPVGTPGRKPGYNLYVSGGLSATNQ